MNHSSNQSAEDILRARYEELAALSGSLAHEIKNPLSVIRMNTELLAEDFENINTPEARRAMERIQTVNRHCVRLENLLNDFLRFNRLDNLELKSGSLNDQVLQILDFYETQARKQGVEIKRYLEADLPSIKMESQTLQAALVNLVKNALEAMPDGGQLVARTRSIKNSVVLDLIDNGCGMETSTLLNMFKTFYTSKEGGSGLGLPTAKKIIEAHGGIINVQSVPGQGTQFSIEFPAPKRI
ncbi:MAG: HAMP domain-containing sensor histidine kinase [Planctomycetota bacterium]